LSTSTAFVLVYLPAAPYLGKYKPQNKEFILLKLKFSKFSKEVG